MGAQVLVYILYVSVGMEIRLNKAERQPIRSKNIINIIKILNLKSAPVSKLAPPGGSSQRRPRSREVGTRAALWDPCAVTSELGRTLAAHHRTATWSAGEGEEALALPRLLHSRVSPLARTQQGEKGKPILKCTKCAIF